MRSEYRTSVRSDGRRLQWLGRILKPTRVTDGRLKVSIAGVTRPVHLLVLEAFIGPRPSGMVACHRDENCTNNVLANLRWDTPDANWDDLKRNGRRRREICLRGHRRFRQTLGERSSRRLCPGLQLCLPRLEPSMAFLPNWARRPCCSARPTALPRDPHTHRDDEHILPAPRASRETVN